VPWVRFASLPFDGPQERWELYDIRDDFSQSRDLADHRPELLAEMRELFDAEARRNGVYPLRDTGAPLGPEGRVPSTPDVRKATYTTAHVRMPERSVVNVKNRSFDLVARGEIDGSITRGDWSGTFWARGQGLKTEQLLQAYLPKDYLLSDLQLNFQAWSYWKRGQHLTTRLQLDLEEVSLYTPDKQILVLDDLKGDLLYEKHDQGWELQLKDFRLTANDYPWRDTGMAVLAQQGKLLLGISQIDMEGAVRLLPLLPRGNPVRNRLEAISPKGLLSAIRISMDLEKPEILPVIRTRFDHLSFLPWDELPGVTNFSGMLMAQKNMAHLTLDTRDAQVLFKTLFRQPLPLNRLEGDLIWQAQDDDNWSLYSDHLLADSPDLQTVSRLRVNKTPDGPPVMDVQTDFRNGKGEHAGLYYPAGIMSDKLVGWLDNAIVSGKVPRGSFLYHGPLAKGHFPFHKTHDGHFEVLFDVEDLKLAYQPDWPPLTGVSANVRFHNNDLSIQADRARIYNTQVRRASASIASLKPLKPLVVKGRTKGPLKDFLRLLRETPLKTSLAQRVAGLAVNGRADTSIQLNIPLPPREKTPPTFRLAVDFGKDASLTLLEQKLKLDNLRGKLLVSEQGLVAEDIRTRALGADITVAVKPDKNKTVVEAQGTVSGKGLVKQYPQLAPMSPKGTANIKLKLDIPGLNADAGTPSRLRIASDLQGMALHLPPPVGKKAAASVPMRLEMLLGSNTTLNTLQYGNVLGVTYKQAGRREPELLIKIASLTVKSWIKHFSDQNHEHGLSAVKPGHILIETEKLDAGILSASSFVLDIRQDKGLWKGQVNADNIRGRIEFSQTRPDRPLTLELEKLYLQTRDEDQPDGKTTSTEKLLPGDFPTIRLSCRKLRLNKANLGKLEFITRKDGENQIIEKLDAHGKLADISIHGSWEYSSGSGTTWLKGVITTDNMGKLLRKALDMDFLSGSKTYISFDLNWLGAPFQPNIPQMQGEAQLDMAAGRFLNFKPGLARVLGLVNFDTLYRRLKLDFKDVYQKGMAFDTIMGNFQFDAGQMYTNNLEILGPSATILLSGSIDLVNETYDQILSVSPRLDATLPVASAIAGGPAAGLVVLLAQQAFSKKLQKIQRITYNVSGSWDDPKLTRHTPKGEEKVDSSILNP